MAKVSTMNRVESVAYKNPLAFGISYIDLLEDKKWEIDTRKWCIEPYMAVNPYDIEHNPVGQARRLSIMKSTQEGISTTMAVKLFHFASYWNVRVMYSLPRTQDARDFVGTRIEPMIKKSPFLKSKHGLPDNASVKTIGNSYLFFMATSTEPRMMPADAVFVDEVDLSNQDHVATMLNRLDQSKWQLNYFFSTPTVPAWGVHASYEDSDMRKWLVRCPACNEWQEMLWERNIRITGDPKNPSKVCYGCKHCSREFHPQEIQDNGQWVAMRPDRTDNHIGYHISQMISKPADWLYERFIDPKSKKHEFWRKRLGVPFEIGGGSISREEILQNCFFDEQSYELGHDGESVYVMGVDQANEIQIVVAKKKPDSDYFRIVRAELVPFHERKGFQRVVELMKIFKVRMTVIDADPNRHNARGIVDDHVNRAVIADYTSVDGLFEKKFGTGARRKVPVKVNINRTDNFDTLIESMKEGKWQLAGTPAELHPNIQLVIAHITSLRRDIETRKTTAGEKDVGVWKNVGPDHLGHATGYAQIAFELLGIGVTKRRSGFSFVSIGADTPATSEQLREVEIKKDHEEADKAIRFLLDEAKHQIPEYLDRKDDSDYNVPFPLKPKLAQCYEQGHTKEDVFAVMLSLDNRF